MRCNWATSASRGTLSRIKVSSVNSPAIIRGSAAFLAPEMAMVPLSGLPPTIRMRSMFDSRIALTSAPNDLKLAYLWITNTFPLTASDSDTRDKSLGVSPPENGTQFGIVEFAPVDHAADPLWHRTRTVDYVVVLSGEIDLMLDDKVVHLSAGDTVVQQATSHAWVNRGSEPCRLLFVLMDAKG